MQYKHTLSTERKCSMNEQQVEKVKGRLLDAKIKFSDIYSEGNEVIVEVKFDDDTDENKEKLLEFGFVSKESRVFFVANRDLPEEKEEQISFLQNETRLLQHGLGIDFRGYSTIDSEFGNLAIMVKRTSDTDENRRKIAEAGYKPKDKKVLYSISEQSVSNWDKIARLETILCRKA